ncbi:OprD family outer membrane porin, partial [Pandoraea sputorum]|uniref:OprD family outer membrane porin n=1 Tax=Pandoraea sputorum TaxID=93222 RepID=UPI0035592062
WGLLHTLPIGPGLLKTDLRIFDSREDGRAESGRVDNRSTGVMFTYQMGAHSFGLAHMRQTGDTAMVYLPGGEPNVLSDGTMSADFVNPKEQTWALRYDYDFAGLGIPGLRAMARYLHGS